MLVSTVNQAYHIEQVIERDFQVYKKFQEKKDRRVELLLSKLSPESPWGDRQAAARILGILQDKAAVPGLLAALQIDNFWKVRCAIIQALEKIADSRAIPVLIQVSQQDSFRIVRSYAGMAVERLSRK